jgi:hypothetical protein
MQHTVTEIPGGSGTMVEKASWRCLLDRLCNGQRWHDQCKGWREVIDDLVPSNVEKQAAGSI